MRGAVPGRTRNDVKRIPGAPRTAIDSSRPTWAATILGSPSVLLVLPAAAAVAS